MLNEEEAWLFFPMEYSLRKIMLLIFQANDKKNDLKTYFWFFFYVILM